MICWSRVIPFIILIMYFLWQIFNYIDKRKKLKKYSQLLQVDDRWDEKYIKLNQWLMKKIIRENEMENSLGIINSDDNIHDIDKQLAIKSPFQESMTSSLPSSTSSLCRELAFLVPESSSSTNDNDICSEMAREVCGIDSQFVEKITIPEGIKTNFVAANGMHLLSGETYCIFNKPPLNSLSSSSSSIQCNERWGYWKFSPILDRWVCHSKVPGVYNAEQDEFSPCKAGGGKFVIDNIEVSPESLATDYDPRQFYDVEFQKRCGCICDEKMGYIFVPEKSRTTCYRDPCRAALPPFSAAPGYVRETGYCDCGNFFTNLFDDNKQPCTACPYERPQYDEKNHTLTVFIKCGGNKNSFFHNDDDDNNDDDDDNYLFPCESDEDKLRGCRKAIFRVKPMGIINSENKIEEAEEVFENRIFW